MDSLPYKFLVIDTEASSLLLTDGASGEILEEWTLPRDFMPLDLQLDADKTIVYIPAINATDRGALFTLNLLDRRLSRLPLDLPSIERFALGPAKGSGILATRDGALFTLDSCRKNLSLFGRSCSPSTCVGLATDQTFIYTVWQHEANGILAVFSGDGHLVEERFLPGLPTNLIVSAGYIFVPFTAAGAGSEGLIILAKSGLAEAQPKIITVQHCPAEPAFRTYPCYVAITPDETTAYLVHEDSATISVVDVTQAAITGYIPVGRSLSYLTLLPDTKLAVAGSNMFADLSLIDLVNQKLISLTDTERELFGQIAVIV